MINQFSKGFHNPEPRYRPKMRWWLPGGFMTNEEIRREIEWLSDAGYGGAEIIHFFAIPTEDVEPADYGKYGFGSDEWNDRMKAALQAAIPRKFQLDFTIGPLWPIATPAIKDSNDDRCTHGLHVGHVRITGSYGGAIPKPETIQSDRPCKLVAVTAAKTRTDESVGGVATLELDSAVDVTAMVRRDTDATIQWTPPSDGEWLLFGFWSQTNGQMNEAAGAPAIDHFSREAAEAVTGYWDDKLLGEPELKRLYEQNAGNIFCDSIELNATLLGGMYGATPMCVAIWTPALLKEFKLRRGYDLTPFLPAIFVEGLYQLSAERKSDGDSVFDFEDRAVNRRIRNDFFTTLTEMFRDHHLKTLRRWAHSHHMQLRYQTYGMPTELTAGLQEVDIPETETLGFHDSTDGYRMQAGAVHLLDREVYSIEAGAVLGYGYKQTWTGKDFGLLWQLHRAFSSGVNQAVLHGMSYESQSAGGQFAPMFQWPGLSIMGSMFSNEWGKRQPTSLHARDLVDYIARMQYVLRQGTPKVDLAVYRYHVDGIHQRMDTNLTVYEQAGYSYDYVSPSLLELEHASVTSLDGRAVLAADGPAYKALLIDRRISTDTGEWHVQALSKETVDRLIQYAEQGLPIFVVGDPPIQSIHYQGSRGRQELEDTKHEYKVKQLLNMEHVVHVASQSEAIEALRSMFITPSAQPQGAGTLLSARRFVNGTNYYYLYNPSLEESYEGDVLLEGEAQVWILDGWTGSVSRIQSEYGDRGSVRVRVGLAPNATVMLALSSVDLGSHDSETMMAGKPSKHKELARLNNWLLTVESWTAGDHPTETKLETIEVPLQELKPWSEIPALRNKSGIGRYRANFHVEDSSKVVTQAVLSLGELCDTFRLRINGVDLPPADQLNRCVEIGPYLHKGSNTIEIEVATTLNNALSVTDAKRELQPYGLIGPVFLFTGG